MSETELLGYFFEDIQVGMEASTSHAVTDADIRAFAAVSGDCNPVHLDEEYASKTKFGARIAHGILSAAYISAVIGTKLPGPGCIYMSQTLNFRAPVYIGNEVVTRVRVTETVPEKKRVILACDCSVNGKTVLEGQAVLLVPARNA
jgi:3-hydroxybutyryl-CoA dehydratase